MGSVGQLLAQDHPNPAEHDPLAGILQQGETVAPKPEPRRLSDIRAQLSVYMLPYRQQSELHTRGQPGGQWLAWSPAVGIGGELATPAGS